MITNIVIVLIMNIYINFIQIRTTIILSPSIHRVMFISAPCKFWFVCFSTSLSPSKLTRLWKKKKKSDMLHCYRNVHIMHLGFVYQTWYSSITAIVHVYFKFSWFIMAFFNSLPTLLIDKKKKQRTTNIIKLSLSR